MVPDYQLIKEFIRWYIHGTRGRVSDNGRPTVKTVLLCAERLFGGFEEDMQLSIPQDDRSEVYNVSLAFFLLNFRISLWQYDSKCKTVDKKILDSRRDY